MEAAAPWPWGVIPTYNRSYMVGTAIVQNEAFEGRDEAWA